MSDQGERGDRKHFVKEINGQQIGREGHPHGGGEGKREIRIETGLSVLVQTAHVSDRIQGGGDPEYGSDAGEEQTRPIHPEKQGHVGEDLPNLEFDDGPAQNQRDHGENHGGLNPRGHESEQLTEVGPLFPRQNDPDHSQPGSQKSDQRTNVLHDPGRDQINGRGKPLGD